MGVRFSGEGKERKLPSLVYAIDSVLCGESEEDLGVGIGSSGGVHEIRASK